MSLGFMIREGMHNMQRARLSSILSVFAISLASLLLSSFALIFYNVYLVSEKWQQNIEFEIFLLDNATSKDKSIIKRTVENFDPSADIQFIDKRKAVETFKKLFNEDAIELLGYNPLPESFRVKINSKEISFQDFEAFVSGIEKKNGVLTVDFAKKQFSSLKKYIHYFYYISGILGILISLVALALIYNTVKLSINSKEYIIQSMRLVGATERIVRWPFIIQGAIESLIGGLLSVGILWTFLEFLRIYTDIPVFYQARWFFIVLALSVTLGVIGSKMAIKKYLPNKLLFK
jgi:cell division transport system permease protein